MRPKPTSARSNLRRPSPAATPNTPKVRYWLSLATQKVICTVSIEESVPPFLREKNQGLDHSRMACCPAPPDPRMRRESSAGKTVGRTREIQRLVGRSLRAVVGWKSWVHLADRLRRIQADGGPRTASITGAFVALRWALSGLQAAGKLANGRCVTLSQRSRLASTMAYRCWTWITSEDSA